MKLQLQAVLYKQKQFLSGEHTHGELFVLRVQLQNSHEISSVCAQTTVLVCSSVGRKTMKVSRCSSVTVSLQCLFCRIDV